MKTCEVLDLEESG